MKKKGIGIKLFMISGLVVFVYLALLFVACFFMQHKITEEINSESVKFAAAVREKYPDISENEIMDILRGGEESGYADPVRLEEIREILGKYGYEGDTFYSAGSERALRKAFVFLILLSLIPVFLLILFFALYYRKKEKKIGELRQYLDNILNGIYGLRLEENGEDELSRLSNELYKVTVRLREASENSKAESKNLAAALADISHQLKTPLTSIRIMLDNIEDDPDMDSETRNDFLRLIGRQTDLISGLVITLLNIAKFDAGTIKLRREETDMVSLLRETGDDLAPLLEAGNVSLTISGNKTAVICADKKWQKQAVTNIIKNCIEHSPENSEIGVSIDDNPIFLKITIEDHGEGIDKKDLPHIFDRFYKAEGASENSVGIGLSLARTIIEKENGQIYCESEKGRGSRFVIRYMKN